jgi:hypothetical protein
MDKQMGAHGSVVVKALSYKLEGRGIDTRSGEFLNLPNPSRIYSVSNRNEYQKLKNNNVSGEQSAAMWDP